MKDAMTGVVGVCALLMIVALFVGLVGLIYEDKRVKRLAMTTYVVVCAVGFATAFMAL
jgi:hypothetical protein